MRMPKNAAIFWRSRKINADRTHRLPIENMSAETGSLLRKARAARGLSIEQAAQATRIGKDQIKLLESGDFHAFPSPAYCRGFLSIYGKFLGVDVSLEMTSLEGSNPLSDKSYDYLKNIPPAPLPEDSFAAPERAPSFVPLIVFLALLSAGACVLWLLFNLKRLGLAN
jgi:cytoskeletal protein RodZ